MTPKEYAKKRKLKPLSKKELKKGKDVVTIGGTDEPMPWQTVFADIAIGKPLEHIIEQYGNGRKIVLWAIEENVEPNPALERLVNEEAEHRKKMNEIAKIAPNVAHSIEEAVNAYAPDLATEAVALSKSLLAKGKELVTDAETGNELLNIAKMMQTITDITGHTQRHASAMQINNNKITVDGFDFVEDTPPPTLEEVIDVNTDNENNEQGQAIENNNNEQDDQNEQG